MLMAMKTGVAKLDELMQGGLRENSNVLVYGPPCFEKLAFAWHFAFKGCQEQQPVVYITTDMAPREIEDKAGDWGARLFSYTDKGIKFLDCYSWTLEQKKTERKDIIVPGPSALNDLSLGITQALAPSFKPGVKTRSVLQSISTLLLYNNPEVVYRFMQIMGARLKAAGSTTLMLADEGMHDEKVVATLKHLADEVIEIRPLTGKTLLLAPSSGIREPLEIRVTKTGVEVVE